MSEGVDGMTPRRLHTDMDALDNFRIIDVLCWYLKCLDVQLYILPCQDGHNHGHTPFHSVMYQYGHF